MTEPKILECFHAFCKPCIKRNAELIGQVNIFKCPKCCFEMLLPELSDVEDLKPSPLHSRILQVLAFAESEKCCSVSASHSPALWHCFDCNRSLCDECLNSHSLFIKDHHVVSLTDLKKEDLEAILTRESHCKTHLNHTLTIFCKDCDVLVCLLCLKDDHIKHNTTSLQEFTGVKKAFLAQNLEEIEKLRCSEMEKKQQEEIAIKMKSDGEKAKEEVKKLTKRLVTSLLDHEQQLLNEIQRNVAKADSNLRIIRHIPAAQEYIQTIIVNGIASDMVDIQEVEGSKRFTYSPFEKNTWGINFNPNKDLSEQVSTGQGNIQFSWKSDALTSTVQVDTHLQALRKAKLSVLTKYSTGELNYDESDVVDVQISPEDDVQVEEKIVKTDGKVEVEFIPRVPGQLTAEVKLNGNPVSNSPLVMHIKPQKMQETGTSKLKTALNSGSNNASGIAVNKANSMIAVAYCSSNCVRVFSINGEELQTYGSQGSEPGQLNNPQELAFLNDIDLVIVDWGNHRISIVNTITGTLVKTFGCHGNGNGEFSNPFGVHVDDESNIIVSDTGNHRVQVFNKDGDYRYQFSLPDQGFKPWCTITHNGLFHVSDSNNAVIHVIEMKDDSPTRISTIGGKGRASGQLQIPTGLAIDNDHNLLVCDQSCGLVHKFTLDGRFIARHHEIGTIGGRYS
ncbi:hypothetical protein QZH41_002874 [Actinostola sp. cb2023]|nr:hypothetical protein QZH41_002874 [Actinostola sp. cb2023]